MNHPVLGSGVGSRGSCAGLHGGAQDQGGEEGPRGQQHGDPECALVAGGGCRRHKWCHEGDASADFNGDGDVDFFDYLDFVDVLSTGC